MAERDCGERGSLATRSTKLERTTRRLVALAFLLVGILVGWVAGSATSVAKAPNLVQANMFVLADADGMMRGQWSIDQEGNGRLVLYGSDGKATLELPSRPRAFPAAR